MLVGDKLGLSAYPKLCDSKKRCEDLAQETAQEEGVR